MASSYTPDIRAYRFCTASGTASINGFLVDENGRRVGNVISGTVNSASVSSVQGLYGATLPERAVGAFLDVSATIRWITVDSDDSEPSLGDMTASAPSIDAGKSLAFGRA